MAVSCLDRGFSAVAEDGARANESKRCPGYGRWEGNQVGEEKVRGVFRPSPFDIN